MNDCMVTSRRFRIISRRVVYSRTKLSLIFMICSHCLSDRRAFSRGLLITPGFLLIISFTCIGSKTNQNVPYINTPFILFLYSLLIKQSLCQYICKTIYNSFYIFFYLCFYFTEELEGIYVCRWFWKSKSYEHNLQMFCNV